MSILALLCPARFRRAVRYNEDSEEFVTSDELAALTALWQERHDLDIDGMYGPATRASVRASLPAAAPQRLWPLAQLPDGRKPVITSGFRTQDRPGHDGVDLFYRYLKSDPQMKAGDGGAVVKKGKRRWWIPPRTSALATEDGEVHLAGKISTGYRCWIDHGNGIRTGYFHLSHLFVEDGDLVGVGDAVGRVGDNPSAFDGVHLHFEVSPVDRYAPQDPRPYLAKAGWFREPDPIVF